MSEDSIDPTASAAKKITTPGVKRLYRAGRPQTARIQRAPIRPEPAREEIRADGERVMRRRRRTEDKFYIDPKVIPTNTSYEWKRTKCFGQPDSDHQVDLRENGWKPVPAHRHPSMMPDGHTGAIEKNGQMLMERPKYLTQEARQEDYDIAREQVRSKEAAIGKADPGTFDRPLARINKTVERVSIPD